MTTHLRLDLTTLAWEGGKYRDMHAQQVMKEFGITYQHATPQSISDQWWFWNCENVPDVLPVFLTPLKNDPYECIGYGLSKEDADKISGYRK